jgi:hypothetical protein
VTYQWEAESPPGSGLYAPVVDAALARVIVSGSRTPTLRVVPRAGQTLPAFFATRYRCTATNACGTTASPAALLTVCAADFNCDGFLDFFDYDDFVAGFETGC